MYRSTKPLSDNDFPLLGLLPKKETGALDFLNKYPEFNGRNVTIGILDSGVDPGAAGLQKTPDGQPKIIDLVDATGSGDVDTSTTVMAIDGTITGITGRKLRIPNSWKNPSNIYHIGVKSSHDLYPKLLRERLSNEYRKKVWEPGYREKLAEIMQNLEDFEKKNTVEVASERIEEKDDLLNRIEVLNSAEKKYSFPPKIFDCVVFHDGTIWRACMDTTETGELEKCDLMASFYEERKFSKISKSDQMNYSFNIWNEGNVLEIVTNAGSHGTHVACIAAGYFEDEPEKNGIAPGAQIVGIKIGDSRLGSMETGTAIVRAIIHLIKRGVKLANYSYGEGYLWPNSGRINEVIEEAVKEHDLIFVSSAGNNGPALGTVGSPGGTCTPIISVGAYVTPDMMEAEYSMRQRLPSMHYTWSSRGPSSDGALGVCISAPGGAIASVANWTLKGSELMNGTSMSSPNACGCIALILSALNSKGLRCGPYTMRRALEHCAFHEQSKNFDIFAAGYGIVSVESTYEHLEKILKKDQDHLELNWNVSITTPKSGVNPPARGIFIREPHQAFRRTEHFVYVKPEVCGDGLEAQKINLNIHARLVCEASYVKLPTHLELMNTGRGFYVQIDPTALETGCYLTEIKAYDSKDIDNGPIWRLPITIIVPKRVPDWNFTRENLSFQPGEIQRHFFVVPKGASYVEIECTNTNANTNEVPHQNHFVIIAIKKSVDGGKKCKPKRLTTAAGERIKIISNVCQVKIWTCSTENPVKLLLHAIQFNQLSQKKLSKFLSLSPNAVIDDNFLLVNDDSTIEITIARWWASLGDAGLSFSVNFKGLELSSKTFTLHGGALPLSVDAKSFCPRAEDIAPSVVLRYLEQTMKPSSFKIKKLDNSRDCFGSTKRQIYGLELLYKVNVSRFTDVTINFAPLSSMLYESDFESQLWMLHDSTTKAFITAGDAFPTSYSKKLEKGDYTIRLQVRHEKQDILEKLKELCVTIQSKLHSNITLDLFCDISGSLVNTRKFPSSVTLPYGESVTFFVAPPSDDKVLKHIGRLSGYLTLSRDEAVRKSVCYPFYYVIPSNNTKKVTKSVTESKLSPKEAEKVLLESEREMNVAHLRKIDEPGPFYEELCNKYGDYLPLHMNYLQVIEGKSDISTTQIIDVCQRALSLIDKNDVLINMGIKNDQRPEANQIKAETEKKKLWLIELYVKFSNCLLDSLEKRNDSQDSFHGIDMRDQLDHNIVNLLSFCDASFDLSTAKIVARHAAYKKLYGKSLKTLLKIIEDRSIGQDTDDVESRVVDICEKVGWTYLANYYDNWRLYNHPKSVYRPF